MDYKYQLITLGSKVPEKQQILGRLLERLKDLGLPKSILKIIDSDNIENEYLGNQPAFGLYLGDIEGDHKDLDITQKLIKDGTMILPIFFGNEEGAFGKEIPCILANQNGIPFKENELDRIANIILESFELLRSTRKIFISYRRNESTSIAIQLYEALESYNYDVFLDTHTIGKGEPFQDELWHRMTDCDVILLLNTPKFLESEWCEKEIAEASVKQIGIIQAIWPNHKLERMAEICFPYTLSESNFLRGIYDNKDTSKLNDETINNLVNQVESIRARNLASRQDNLITEFLNSARKYGKNVTIQPERFITEEIDNNKRRIFIPSVGIPQSFDCNTSSELKKEIKEYSVEEVYLIYDDVRIREKWLNHLSYLNEYLDVKTIKKQEFDLWLQKN